MTEKESAEPQETEHSYLDVGPTGPRRWVLVIVALFVILALLSTFYGLYTINLGGSPTLSPDPAVLTQAVAVQVQSPNQATSSVVPALATPTPILTRTFTITATAKPPSYTIQQGDSLISIAHRLNVSVDDLTGLNQIGGETIFPGQVLLVPPTVTPWPETGPFPHVVSRGETLISIATLYGVTVEELKTLNGLASDNIFDGQSILIPASGLRPPTPTPTPEPWVAAIITDDLAAVYSLRTIRRHFTLHIPPDTHASSAGETAKVSWLVQTALKYSRKVLQRSFAGRFQVYVAHTLFEAPQTVRRSFSLPDAGRLFLLYDGSGTPAERLYFTTYALIPLVAAQTLGEAATPLLREGLAVHVAGEALISETLSGRPYLSPHQFCAAYQQAGTLPRVSTELAFGGHLGHLDQHVAAGCFVGYLMDLEGAPAFNQVYVSGDYGAIYGRTLTELEADWLASLRAAVAEPSLDPGELVRVATGVDDAYRRLWADFAGTPPQFAAYARLNLARLAMLQGRLRAAQEHLQVFETLLSVQ